MMIREPAVAGHFYPNARSACERELLDCLTGDVTHAGVHAIAGIVPHAGWMCSGRVAGKVFRALAQGEPPRTVVLFGAVHRVRSKTAALFPRGKWETPLGQVEVNERLGDRCRSHCSLIAEDAFAHEDEHSIEVQVPFVQKLFPEADILPIMVPPIRQAVDIGKAVGGTLQAYQYKAVVVGTTDLTHYGPSYGLTSHGSGSVGEGWARENDRRMIELMASMDAGRIVEEAAARRNACGAGAVAATIAAAASLGAARGIVLEHTSSRETLAGRFPGDMDNSVGYAGVIFV